MALQGPRLVYVRDEEEDAQEGAVPRALRLAREIEELLASTRGEPDQTGVHSTRIVRAVAASLVDELEGMIRGRAEHRSA